MTYQELTKGRFSAVGQDYFITFNTKRRKPVLAQYPIAQIVAKTIHYDESIHCLAWVIMPDHVHLLMTLNRGTISEAIKRIKGSSSREINKVCSNFKWSRGYYEHTLRKEEARDNIARYIVANPLRAKLVKKLADYPWWNAIFL